MAKVMIVPVFIPHLGCPHQCVFCDQHKITGETSPPDANELEKLVRQYRLSCRNLANTEIQLAFYGGSFTGIAVPWQESLLQAAMTLKANKLLDKIRLSTRADYIDHTVLTRLAHYQVDIIELGVQSLDDGVLEKSQRGHTALDVAKAVALIKEYHFTLGLQMMLALPGDTPEKSLETAQKIIALQPDFVRIYPTAVIKDTKLAEMMINGIYQPWSLDVVIDTVAQIADEFMLADIPIIRIGLQAADNLVWGKDLLGGAYHPAMGELVKNRQIFRRLTNALAKMPDTMVIYCNKNELSQFIGQKKNNLYKLRKIYHSDLAIKADEALPKGIFELEQKGERRRFDVFETAGNTRL